MAADGGTAEENTSRPGVLTAVLEAYPRLSQVMAGLWGFVVASWMFRFGWIPFGG